MTTASETPGKIEQHTIYQIPIDQRHGRARDLFTIWFGANIHMLTIVTGALASTVFKLPFLSAIGAIVFGNLVGAIFMALHAAQGPRLGCRRWCKRVDSSAPWVPCWWWASSL